MWPAGFPPLAVCSALELLHQEQLGLGGQEGSREAAEPRGCVVGLAFEFSGLNAVFAELIDHFVYFFGYCSKC